MMITSRGSLHGQADLVITAKPAPRPAGLAITAALVVMPALAVGKRRRALRWVRAN
jgi:hypothetical protein